MASAQAADDPPSVVNRVQQGAGSDDYWTPERLRSAKPLILPSINSSNVEHQAAPRERNRAEPEGQKSQSGLPTANVPPNPNNPLFKAEEKDTRTAEAPVAPGAASYYGALYTHSRVFPLSAVSTYPHSPVGRLFFSDTRQGLDYICSASVINRRVLVTAGHCVYNAASNARYFYSRFLFVPSYDNGNAPYGRWGWSYAITTNIWAAGGGAVPNAADYALIELGDQVISGATRRAGDVTGWLGWRTLYLTPNHITILGLPANLDSGLHLQRTDTQSFSTTNQNTVEFGSPQGGGSSGGPYVTDFGITATGQVPVDTNQVVGVMSYGYVNPAIRQVGASIFDSRFTQIWTLACGHRAGNCS
jgi:V8-like Glu-specific endopeptidase